ncbi:hypothetical protein B0J12DRAFT_355232 [Macrophomina phaseolina]|uniref:Uncharacterized protein n=1 Tax=Macrophomina phaseolina TaxID=35725 RepID=A0ABQ8FUL4_9PEZI|nr:hypothetical protein B0J12DRAFT_355232 [Macrophomina phaseolina]
MDSSQRYVANEARAVLTWHDTDTASDISLRPVSPATLLMSLDVSQRTAAIRFRIPSDTLPSHAHLFTLIDPRNVRHLTADLQPTAIPECVRLSSIAEGSTHDITKLEFHLYNPPTVVGPASAAHLRPRGRVSGNLLACLKSMLSAHTLVVFVAKNSLQTELLSLFCTQVSNAGLLPSITDYALERLYEGRGGKDIGDLLSAFILRPPRDVETGADGLAVPVGEEPPTYDEVQRETPRLSPALAGASSLRGKS